jgi:hypothetical protein
MSRGQVSHPHNANGKIIDVHISIFGFLAEKTKGPELNGRKHYPNLTYSYFLMNQILIEAGIPQSVKRRATSSMAGL